MPVDAVKEASITNNLDQNDKYGRDTYTEEAVMKQYGIPAEKKSSSTSYKESTVLFESDFDEDLEQSHARKSSNSQKDKGKGKKIIPRHQQLPLCLGALQSKEALVWRRSQ